jgi:hypothetical protein
LTILHRFSWEIYAEISISTAVLLTFPHQKNRQKNLTACFCYFTIFSFCQIPPMDPIEEYVLINDGIAIANPIIGNTKKTTVIIIVQKIYFRVFSVEI